MLSSKSLYVQSSVGLFLLRGPVRYALNFLNIAAFIQRDLM